LWFAGTLVPVIGIVQAGLQSRADRYTYVPLIGLFIMAAWGVSELSSKWRYRKESLAALSTVVLACLCLITWTQIRYWRNSITLFSHTLDVTDNNSVAYYNRGASYSHIGDDRQALADYDKALSINPRYADAYYNRGTIYLHLENYGQAIRDFDKALSVNPINANAYHNRGLANSHLGNYQQAIGDYDKTIEMMPAYAEPYNNRAYAYLRLGNTGQAIEDMKRAARLGYQDAQRSLKSQGIGW
jgi:tetratricopeptide (TPR) repeat protein